MAITDDFTDTNGTALDSHGNWEQTYSSGGGAAIEIQSNAIEGTVGGSSSIYRRTDGTFDDDHYAQIVFVSVTSAAYFGPGTRGSGDGDGYIFSSNSGNNYLSRFTNGGFTILGSAGTGASASEVHKLVSSGTSHTPYVDDSVFSAIGAQTDATYGSGAPCIRSYDNAATVADDFECSDLPSSAQTISAAGGVASGETVPSQTIALSARQSISSAGAVASGEVVPSQTIALSARQSVASAGGVASAEAFESDNSIADVLLQIASAGAIASLEGLESDNSISIPAGTQTVSAAGAVSSAESVPTQTIANVVQSILAAGGVVSGEVFSSDSVVALATRKTLTSAGAIASAEAFEADNYVEELLLLISPSSIASAESVPTSVTVGDLVLDNPGDYSLAGTATDINGAIHVVSVSASFGGAVGDVYIQGVRHTVSGAMYVTFDSPDSSAVYINGILHTVTGIRYVVNSAGSDKWPEGFGTDSGKLGTTTVLGGFFLRGIARTVDGRMVIDI